MRTRDRRQPHPAAHTRAVLIVSSFVLLVLLQLPGAVNAEEDGPGREGTDVPESADKDTRRESLAESLSTGRLAVNLRYRYELVDQVGIAPRGLSSTLRTTLGYTSRPYRGFALGLEAESVADVGADQLHRNLGFGDRGNGIRGRPVVADPPGTDMLQAWAQYRGSDALVRLGRQEITYDDHRFVGNVGFRQHHQSFRALRLDTDAVAALSVRYSYIDRVYRITGARQDTNHHLINLAYRLPEVGTLTSYGYVLRYDSAAAATLSSNTLGIEIKGQRALGTDRYVRYEVELAHQSNAGNNPDSLSQSYVHLMLGAGYGSLGVRVGWERLGGDRAEGRFQTPLATLHAFNGWADQFLSTPRNGLEDLYVRADGPAGPLSWVLAYHDFNAATGETDYGSELDFQITYRAPWAQLFGFRGAVYRAEEFATDTTKIWLYSGYSF